MSFWDDFMNICAQQLQFLVQQEVLLENVACLLAGFGTHGALLISPVDSTG